VLPAAVLSPVEEQPALEEAVVELPLKLPQAQQIRTSTSVVEDDSVDSKIKGHSPGWSPFYHCWFLQAHTIMIGWYRSLAVSRSAYWDRDLTVDANSDRIHTGAWLTIMGWALQGRVTYVLVLVRIVILYKLVT
jgi:hypothetical protein